MQKTKLKFEGDSLENLEALILTAYSKLPKENNEFEVFLSKETMDLLNKELSKIILIREYDIPPELSILGTYAGPAGTSVTFKELGKSKIYRSYMLYGYACKEGLCIPVSREFHADHKIDVDNCEAIFALDIKNAELGMDGEELKNSDRINYILESYLTLQDV